MAERIRVGGIDAPKIVRPTAAPVDTFVGPPRASDVEQIAQGLAQFVPSLSRFAGLLGQQKGEKARAEGQAAADQMKNAGRTLAEDVKAGKIRPDENPWFRVGFYETAGRNAGAKYVGDFLEALGNSAVKDSVELKDFDEFERKFRSAWVPQNLGDDPEPFLANAFGSTADGQIDSFRNTFAQQAGSRMVKLNTENFHSEIFNTVQRFAGTDFSTSERAAIIRLAQDRQVATGGMTFDQVNRLTASAVAAAAVRMRDVSVLDMLDQIPTDVRSKGFLGGTSYGAEIREEAENAISRAIDDDARREEVLTKRTREKALKAISSGLMDTLEKDPGADIAPFLKELKQVDPTYAPTLLAMRDAVAGGVYTDDPDLVRSLVTGIHTQEPGAVGYTTQRQLDNALAAKRLTFQTYRTLTSDLTARDDAGGTGRFLRNPILTDISSETYRMFVSEYPDGLITPAIRMNAQAASDEAEQEMLQFLLKNPTASPDEVLKMKTAIRERIVRTRIGLQEPLNNTGAGTQGAAAGQVKPAGFLLVEPLLVGQLQRELEEVEQGRRNRFSAPLLATLRLNQIDPESPEKVRKFLADQMKWTTSSSPKP